LTSKIINENLSAILNQSGRCDLPAGLNSWRDEVQSRVWRQRVAGFNMKRMIFASLIAAAAFGASAPSQAADLGPDGVRRVRHHVRTTWHYSTWRDRCAYAGYYCLYAWDGYVYHYPFDDRPSAYAYYSRRHGAKF
jgi:hypothetical protein